MIPTWLRNLVSHKSAPARQGRITRRGNRSRACKHRFQRPELELLEDRALPSVTIASSYAGLDFNHSGGFVPPDTCGAAGPSSYVETVNQEIAIYSPKATGATQVVDSLNDFWFTVGALPHADSGSILSDPIVVYDDQAGRFIVGDQDVDFGSQHVSNFDIAVSQTSNPSTLTASDWKFYSI